MSEYLTKEEIKQWRSSLEKITLEEFAARLGKKVEEKKETNDLIDIVLHGKPVISEESEWNAGKVERLSAIADRAYEKEKELYVSPFSAQSLKIDEPQKAPAKATKSSVEHKKETVKETKNDTKETKVASVEKPTKTKKTKTKKTAEIAKEVLADTKTGDTLRDEVRLVFKKALTEREQKVLDYFMANQNKIVYAKDLATLLDLPRDYVYKYIKNLRTKIEGESLKNADKGGFVFSL